MKSKRSSHKRKIITRVLLVITAVLRDIYLQIPGKKNNRGIIAPIKFFNPWNSYNHY